MGVSKAASAACSVLAAFSLQAKTPCEFKGLSVGDHLTKSKAMAILGVAKFKSNPTKRTWEESQEEINKYGLTPAAEIEDWNIGPHCSDSSCTIPFGVNVGSNIPVAVLLEFDHDLLTNIEVRFATTYWNDITPILDEKYGVDWDVETTNNFATKDLATDVSTPRYLIALKHRAKGVNAKTRDRCELTATNFDLVFEHHDPMGPFHSVFEIALVSKN